MSNTRRLILPPGIRTGSNRIPIRNAAGEECPCNWQDCMRPADDRYQIQVPHQQPRWRNLLTGAQEMLVYTFCGEEHRRQFAVGTQYQHYLQ